MILSSNPPALMMSAMMMGLLVAPLTPQARTFFTSLGSIESSQTLVPVEMSCLSDMRPPCVGPTFYGARFDFAPSHSENLLVIGANRMSRPFNRCGHVLRTKLVELRLELAVLCAKRRK